MATYLAYDLSCPTQHEILLVADSMSQAKAIANRQGWTVFGKEREEQGEIDRAIIEQWLTDPTMH